LPRHASNSERIAHAAAEADATAKEKAAKVKAPRAPRVRTPRAPKAPPRVKIVWAVGKPGGTPTQTYPYPQRAAAEAEAKRMGGEWVVAPLRVPMEATE
jgi:hypothetical protein